MDRLASFLFYCRNCGKIFETDQWEVKLDIINGIIFHDGFVSDCPCCGEECKGID